MDALLRHIAQAACSLAGAMYAALGVIAADGGLEQFIHVGMPDAMVAEIGHLPEAKGLLGALISDPRPIRLQHITDDDRLSGLPAEHHTPDPHTSIFELNGPLDGGRTGLRSAIEAISAEVIPALGFSPSLDYWVRSIWSSPAAWPKTCWRACAKV